jgi:GT2 family glycosyltransferase
VIPSHNRPDLLRACLASVTRHAPAGTEVLVVDDASPGGSVAASLSEFSEVLYLRLPRRSGFCLAANAGIRGVCGTVVELLNDDTEVTPGWAEAALAHFADDRVAAVAPLVLCWDGPGSRPTHIDSAGDRYFVGGVAGKRGHRQPLQPRFLRCCEVFGASASSAFYRRDILLEVGALAEDFGAYFEDVDLSFRLQRAGKRAIYEPQSRVLHRVSASYGRTGRRLLEQQARNEELVFWRNLPVGVLLRALPLHLAVLAAKGWRRWQDGQVLPFVLGRLAALANLPAILRHRSALSAIGPDVDLAAWRVEDRFW